MKNALTSLSVAIGLCAAGLSGPARADFLQPSVACPGAIETVEFDPSTPGAVLEVRIPSGATATCNDFPLRFPVPRTPSEVGLVVTQIVGDGSDITFVNNVGGLQGQTPIFEAVLTGPGHTVTNNGDLFLLLDGDDAEVTNQAGFMTGLIQGDDARLDNTGVILGLTLEGDRARVTNDGAIAEGFPTPVLGARGMLVIGADADIRNNGGGAIGVQGPEAIAAGVAGNRSTIVNEGSIVANGTEAIGAGIEGNGTPGNRVSIETSGSIEATGTEAIAAIVEGNFATVENSGTVTASGREARALTIEGDNGELRNQNVVTADGDLSAALLLEGSDGEVTNSGAVTATGEVAIGMAAAGTSNAVRNLGSVEATGQDAIAVGAIGGASITNESGSTVVADGVGALGLALGLRELPAVAPPFVVSALASAPAEGSITNRGDVTVGGDGAAAIHGFVTGATVRNEGELSAQGDDARGIDLRLDGQANHTTTVINTGNVRAFNGAGVAGIHLDRGAGAGDANAVIGNGGLVFAQGASARGIAGTGVDATLGNDSRIEVSGANSAGVSLSGGTVVARNGDNANPAVAAEILASGAGATGLYVAADAANVSNQGSIAVSGGGNTGLLVEATSGGAFLVENGSSIDAAGVGMRVINSAGAGAEFSASAGASDCVGAAGAGLLNCGTINATGDGAVGMQGTSILDFVVENSGTIEVTGANSTGLMLDSVPGSPSAGNIVLSLDEITVGGSVARGVVIDGVSNTLAHGLGAHVIPLAPGIEQIISIELDRVTSREGDLPAPTAVIEANGPASIGVDVAGTANNVSLALTSVRQPDDTFIDVPAEVRALGDDASIGVNINGNQNRLINNGRITSDGIGVRAIGNDNTLSTTGFLDSAGGIAFDVTGFGNTIEALGADPIDAIRVNHFGTRPETSTTTIVNATELSGGIAVDGEFQGVNVEIENRESGEIGAVERAVEITRGNNVNVVNRGEIAAIGNRITVVEANAEQNASVQNFGVVEGVIEGVPSGSFGGNIGLRVAATDRAEVRNDGTVSLEVLSGFGAGTGVSVRGAEAAYLGSGDVIVTDSEFSRALSVFSDRAAGTATEQDLHINNGGTLSALSAPAVVARTATTGLIENHGTIVNDANDVAFTLRDMGALEAEADAAAARLRIHNGSTGVIETYGSGQQYAVKLTGTGEFEVVNDGTIATPTASLNLTKGIHSDVGVGDVAITNNGRILAQPGSFAITTSGGNDSVRNVGTIEGRVSLGDGNDTFEAAGGRDGQPSLVEAGESSDTLVADSATATALTGDRYREFERFQKTGDGITLFDGTLRLQGDNSLAEVFAGDLIFDDAELNAATTVVAEGALIRGDGVISGVGIGDGRFGADIDVLGGILPGTSPGAFTLVGDVTLSGFFGLEIGELVSDLIQIEGDLTVDGGSLILSLLDDFVPDFGSTFDLLTITGSTFGLDTLNIVSPLGISFDFGLSSFEGGARLFVSATDPTAVPEPSTLALCGIGLAAAGLARRWRKGCPLG